MEYYSMPVPEAMLAERTTASKPICDMSGACITVTFGPIGAKCLLDDGPNNTTQLAPATAARCDTPLSLPT